MKALGRDSVQPDMNIDDSDRFNQERDRRGSSHMQKVHPNQNKLVNNNRGRVTSEDSDSLADRAYRNNDGDSDNDDDLHFARVATGHRERIDSEEIGKRGEADRRVSTFVNFGALNDDDDSINRRDTNLMVSGGGKVTRNNNDDDY